ncbi:hypothetical protein PRIPAC_73777 [Pristionchus pacificus]|uniref:DUF1758 domain-containing protein n=1 Tax=Pristionchus pacificus TaxID=54126 RepID=A0A2A6BG10_PRIPA|nr:hypothetical protein PRIPAC_73777 [Pristionchus pacificus]|eukprot:PDM64819.1 hypothetical protein PRIPAC_53075 [Pristionchus pacificus]
MIVKNLPWKDSAARATDEMILLSRDLQIVNPRSNVEMRSTVFFDNGAQKSFIHDDLAHSLHLVPIDHTQMDISTFCNHLASFPSSRSIVQMRHEDFQPSLQSLRLESFHTVDTSRYDT